ncbi:cation:H+ antiporter [Shimia gijangensis]|uniref:Cation:H+ antiporter n=1 Tax=Shimia gijangensis TaxID=1470563 RepID=A0A1M6F9H1_9RHOB|nr:calcium/sodium antiporter [Shimia gijangensis]SHI94320.1 cation:H+ antiporter [Shimia gijangensis]
MVWLYAGLGLIILLLAGDALVRGAVNLALRLGIPALIVSLTIVAFGTSAPELLISIQAVLKGVPGIAIGNVVGSNTANILLVLGFPAILAVLHTSSCESRKSFKQMIVASLVFIALAFRGVFDIYSGTILLTMLAYILIHAVNDAKNHRRACGNGSNEDEPEGADPDMPWWKIMVFLGLGLIGLPLGADLLIDSAEILARRFGVSESVIGLTLVALGTSLPELATTTMAALRRQADVALGNVIGSNMFNLLAIIGIASFVGPLPVDPSFLCFDLWVMLGASILLVPFVFFKQDINRVWGIALTLLYVLYIVCVFLF